MLRKATWLVRTPRRAILTGSMVAVLAVSGWAIASWLTQVQNPNSAGKLSSISVTAGTTPTAPSSNPCSPGNTCDGAIQLNNTGTTALTITGVTAVPANGWSNSLSTVSGGQGVCALGDITGNISVPAQSGLSIPVPVGSSSITIPGLYSLANGVPSGCQGATFKLVVGTGSTFNVAVTG